MGANICLPAPLRPGRDRGAQLQLRGTSSWEQCCQAVAGTLPPASGCRCIFMGCRRKRQGHRSQNSCVCCSRGRGETALPRALRVLHGGQGAETRWVGESSPPAQTIPSGLLHRDQDLCALGLPAFYIDVRNACVALCSLYAILPAPGLGGTSFDSLPVIYVVCGLASLEADGFVRGSGCSEPPGAVLCPHQATRRVQGSRHSRCAAAALGKEKQVLEQGASYRSLSVCVPRQRRCLEEHWQRTAEREEVLGWVSEAGMCSAAAPRRSWIACAAGTALSSQILIQWDLACRTSASSREVCTASVCPAQHQHIRTWSRFLWLLLAELWCRCLGLAPLLALPNALAVARMGAGRVLCGSGERAHAPVSLHAAGHAQTACVEWVTTLGRRLRCRLPPGRSRQLGLRVCWSDLVRAAEGKHLENHPGSIGVSESLPATLQA